MIILTEKKTMETIKNNCIICGSKATRKLHVEINDGFFLLCERDVCKEVLSNQLIGAFKNQN